MSRDTKVPSINSVRIFAQGKEAPSTINFLGSIFTNMKGGGISQIDEQIERVRAGGTLTEHEVKELCEKER